MLELWAFKICIYDYKEDVSVTLFLQIIRKDFTDTFFIKLNFQDVIHLTYR